jgi:hypothetical protein
MLGAKVNQDWIAGRTPLFNTIWQKIDSINRMVPGPLYKNKRIISTKSKPARYWLNEKYSESERKYKRVISVVTVDYALIGIKGNWKKRIGKKHVTLKKRDTLKRALEWKSYTTLS